jgi:hypothetical protein
LGELLRKEEVEHLSALSAERENFLLLSGGGEEQKNGRQVTGSLLLKEHATRYVCPAHRDKREKAILEAKKGQCQTKVIGQYLGF